jgi:hypothetical protein
LSQPTRLTTISEAEWQPTTVSTKKQSNEKQQQQQEPQINGVMTRSRTNPPFSIWLYPPEEDTISKHRLAKGVYEPEEIAFTALAAAATGDDGVNNNNNNINDVDTTSLWAVDIGANIGFHALHMASLGMNVIAFEPAPDTANLLQKSIWENDFTVDPDKTTVATNLKKKKKGSITLVLAAAGEAPGVGRLVRHSDSAGMTILQRKEEDDEDEGGKKSSVSLPFGVNAVIADNIKIVRPESALAEIIIGERQSEQQPPNHKTGISPSSLKLLKVDAEGHELHAFRGVNLERSPFQYITFEFFPVMLEKAGQTDPLELLLYIVSFGYHCTTHPHYLKAGENLIKTPEDARAWYETRAVPAVKASSTYHGNIYCHKAI